MGTIIKISSFTKEILAKTNIPVVFCSPSPVTERLLHESKHRQVSLNLPLAKALTAQDENSRLLHVTDEVLKIVPSGGAPVYLTDYEMLFDPRYRLDVLRLFCDISRKVKLAVHWPGTFESNTLYYAEPGCPDYHTFNIQNFDILCVA
ncbi:BREX-3 system P-loop-containing protein BrxF [Treponema primitia]|uniref:BREX-3 system P-loop-containing protein BrxF n=1 Tax=Treponema primitia TaxID=88058 RepID=UPI0002554BFE|nr:BREX-3 system P-loop-containing protein BrxF [Treponema primitia]